MKENTTNLLVMLGIAMTMPMILLSGPFAGYILSKYFFVKFFGLAEKWTPAFVGLGFFASALQCFQLIQKIKSLDTNSAKNKKDSQQP